MTETNEHPASPEPPEVRPGRAGTFLGRLAQALRQQNWAAVVIEVGIVVLGVVIGFQVTAWGQRQNDRAQEREYLHALVTDLRADTTQIQNAIGQAERRAVATHQILGVISGDADLKPPDLAVAVEESMWFNFPAYTQTTISELTSTGNLRLLRDAALRRNLSEYYQRIERLDQWTGNWRRIQMDLEAVLPEILDVRHRDAITTLVNGVPLLPWASELGVSAEDAETIRRRLRTHPTYETRLKGMARIHGTLYSHLTAIQTLAVKALQSAEGQVAATGGAL